MYEPITLEIDRANGEGTYRSYSLHFVGRLIRMVESGHTKMRLYEWADRRGRLLYLVHVEEVKPGRPARRTLYPFINTHSGGGTPRKGYTAEEVSRAYPEFAAEKYLWPTWTRAAEVDGLDVRGEGGYVVAPPSSTSRAYRWIDRSPPAGASWLLGCLKAATSGETLF